MSLIIEWRIHPAMMRRWLRNSRSRIRRFQRNNRGGPSNDHAFSRPPTRFCLFISSALALLIDTARFKLCACLVSRSRSLLFHHGEGGEKRDSLARFPRRTNLFFSLCLSLSLSKKKKKKKRGIDSCKIHWSSFQARKN